MALEDEAANERIAYVHKRQDLLASAVTRTQRVLYAAILDKIDAIAANPAELDVLFYRFIRGDYAALVERFASDIQGVAKANGTYFQAVASGELAKDYSATKQAVQKSLLNRFGLTESGEMKKDGFFDLFIRDTSVQQQVKKAAYQLQYSGKGPKEFAQVLSTIIQGDETNTGAYEKHFTRYVYDTYQQADAELQDQYADRLDLPAALYSGGTVRDSRSFCKERNGKVWLRSEIATWNKQHWTGKIESGSVEVNRGGYNCRHHFSFLTAKQAVQRREDLVINEKGNLQIKS